MNRPWKVWLIFGLCLAVLLAAMGWVSLTALRLDRAQRESQRQAEFEEKVRLALWRMDSILAPLIVQESSRPYFAYNSFFSAERAYNRMFTELRPGEVMLPSPLLTEVSTNVLLHFQFLPNNELTSPQVPTSNQRDLAEANGSTDQQISIFSTRLEQLRGFIDPKILAAACSTNISSSFRMNRGLQLAYGGLQQQGFQQMQAPPPQSGMQQLFKNTSELQARAQINNSVANLKGIGENFAPGANISEGIVTPVWFDQALVLARRVSVENRRYIQGCWLNWTNVKTTLLASIKDLLPAARLEPLPLHAQDPQGRMLASLPVRFAPGPLPPRQGQFLSPIQFALGLSWACVVLAGLAVGVLLHGALSLSERRGAFVSAVTHELRTPLTTFKMYSEMLAEGMVQDQEKTKAYLATLCSEANRLSHLVENVLAYARLERGSARRRIEKISTRDLIERVKMRLLQRAGQAGMELVVDSDQKILDTPVHVDVGAVEQILFNLVDNACKYAAPSASQKLIHLEALPDGKFAMLRVRDHGQGISKEGARRLFRPFSKSAHEAAHSAPGVGLGLALCRRLSRSMGGDLRLDQLVQGGACFVLTLPISPANGLALDSASIT